MRRRASSIHVAGWRGLALACVLLGAAPAAGRDVLVLGDSWAFATAPALQQVFDTHGHAVGVVNAATPGETAANLARPPGLQSITNALAANPDADLVHLSIGGNDFLNDWSAGLSPSQEDALFTGIVADTQTIVQHILAQRPWAQVFQPSYDYPRPLPIGTPLEVNTASEELADRIGVLAAATPGMTFLSFNGLMQLHFGFPTLGIPPFDPSLPRLDLPGPEEAFSDPIHLTAQGYLIFAEAHYDAYYRFLLSPTAVPTLSWPARLVLAALLPLLAALRREGSRTRAPPDHHAGGPDRNDDDPAGARIACRGRGHGPRAHRRPDRAVPRRPAGPRPVPAAAPLRPDSPWLARLFRV